MTENELAKIIVDAAFTFILGWIRGWMALNYWTASDSDRILDSTNVDPKPLNKASNRCLSANIRSLPLPVL